MIMTIGAILLIAIATSTAEGRAKAGDSVARYNFHALAGIALIWGILLIPLLL